MLVIAQSSREFDPKPQAKILPVDQAIGHPNLLQLRAQLIEAARRHDLATILTLSEASVGVGCKDDLGHAALRRLFEREEFPYIWSEFHKSLTLGGRFVDGAFHTNYVVQLYAGQPGEEIDGQSYMVVTGSNVPVYKRPTLQATAVAHLSYDVVLTNSSTGTDWVRVEFAPSKFGFVRSSSLEDPIGISVIIAQRDGKWRIAGLDWACE